MLSQADFRAVISKKLIISCLFNRKTNRAHSGFVLSPCSIEAREAILNEENDFFFSGARSKQVIKLIPIIVLIILIVQSMIREQYVKAEVSNFKPHR